jgi:curved DNA-binding protein CbpA
MFRRLQEQNHYQVLEVSYDASSDEIQSAYEVARDIYSHDALVSGSILSDHERRRTFDRIAEAYQTLIAEESRRLYDQRLGLSHKSSHPVREAVSVPEPRERELEQDVNQHLDQHLDQLEETQELDQIEAEPEPDATAVAVEERPRVCPIQLKPAEEASGAFLKKAREAMGLELSTISEETKIGRSMLEYIETERLDRLPATVYLRNFTRQIARCLGLDEERVATSYLDRIRRRAANSH